jgi:hypothetical protein
MKKKETQLQCYPNNRNSIKRFIKYDELMEGLVDQELTELML